ncbi:YqjF family protein [Streptomyces cinerochromogenes]|uniref:YqjF family protein n=1 Tax=Streptomyces cinerochromogenes TaxID=66422 RepID=UPI00368B894B
MRVVTYGPEHRVRMPALRAGWLTQTFLHWAYAPELIQRLLPDELTVDTFDGHAWVGLTPFVMADVRPPGCPVALAAFPETNLRTYVRGPGGREGLWFLSIEVASPVMLAARAIGAPYHLGRLRLARSGESVTYAGSRWGGGSAYRMTVRPGPPIRPTHRDVWLASRWRAFTHSAGALWETPVEHEPWPLRAARLDDLAESVTRAAGLPAPAEEPLVHFSDGVHKVRLGLSRPVRPQSRRQG